MNFVCKISPIPMPVWSIVFIALSITGCAEKPTIEDVIQTVITGKITDAKDNSAIVGASISTIPPTTTITTDEQGWFVIDMPGLDLTADYTVVVTKDGYVTKEAVIKVVIGQENKLNVTVEPIEPKLVLDSESVRFDLDVTTLFFEIKNDGNAVLEWEVQFAQAPWLKTFLDGNKQDDLFTGSTEPGSVSVLKLVVVRELATEKKELFNTSFYIRPIVGGAGRTVTVEMVKELPPATIVGTVTNAADNTKIENALVVTQPPTTTVRTDSQGLFLIDLGDLESDIEYTIIVSAEGFLTKEQAFSVRVVDENSVAIALDVAGELSVSPEALAFGTETTKLNLLVENLGQGGLDWSVGASPSWLKVVPDGGSIDVGAPGTRLTVEADRSSLRGGDHTEILEILSVDGEQTVSITVTIYSEKPIISIAARTIRFGATTESYELLIDNIGQGTLQWRIEELPIWLTAEPKTGVTDISSSTVLLTVDRMGQDEGELSSSIKLLSNSIQDPEIELTITITITPAPRLSVNLSLLEFADDLNGTSFEISNSNNGVLEWELSEDVEWLDVNPNTGSLGAGETIVVNASVSPAGLVANNYEETIKISSNGGQAEVDVAMNIPQSPEISVLPSEVSFGASSVEEILVISNNGSGILSWTVTDDTDWIELDVAQGQTLAEVDTITLGVRRDELPAGVHTGVVTIESDGGSAAVNVSIEIPQNKQLVLSVQELVFPFGQDKLSFTIENTGNIAIEADLSATQTWIRLDPSNPAIAFGESIEVVVMVDRTDLIAGTHDGLVAIRGGLEDLAVSVYVDNGELNSAPIANAGPDQEVVEGGFVQLDGSGSLDADGDNLTYSWTTPQEITLNNNTWAKPAFYAGPSGTVEIQLVVNDGDIDSVADTVLIQVAPANRQPVADAGPDQEVEVGARVTLDGSGSSDADGDPLTYAWTVPSEITVNSETSARPSFSAESVGTYTFRLVVSDGQANSSADVVQVKVVAPANRQPVADAGPDQEVEVGARVTLDGSGSSDADGDNLTYEWTPPAGVRLNSKTSVRPSFTAEATGSYTIRLVVNDGKEFSKIDFIQVDVVPIDGEGQLYGRYVQSIRIQEEEFTATGPGERIDLTFTATGLANVKQFEIRLEVEPNGILDFESSSFAPVEPFVALPGHSIELMDGGQWRTGGASFGEAKEGDGVLGTLTVVTGDGFSASTEVGIKVVFFSLGPSFSNRDDYGGSDLNLEVLIKGQTSPNRRPVADAGIDQEVEIEEEVTLDGSLSSDPEGASLRFNWRAASENPAPLIFAETQPRISFVPTVPGTYTFILIVSDGTLDSNPDSIRVGVGGAGGQEVEIDLAEQTGEVVIEGHIADDTGDVIIEGSVSDDTGDVIIEGEIDE